MEENTKQKRIKVFIAAVSLLIPLVVALLYFLPKPENISAEMRANFFNHLPLAHAVVNGTTFFVLILAWVSIVKKKVELHKKLMFTALVLSVFFLVSYVAYHYTTPSTEYPKDADYRSLYLFILLSHILLSAAIVPLVLISFVRALAEKFDKHRKIARITMPLWLYVSATGVIVYLMISPYY